tara:strand:+ start:1485 stop:2852 length:1368 start_codon:yes stop_codon:yes gene_type:complete
MRATDACCGWNRWTEQGSAGHGNWIGVTITIALALGAARNTAMKLTDLEVFVVGNPPPGWGGRYFIFVKLTTSDGISGYGEVYAAAVGPQAMQAVIEDVFARHMLGENPENTELMFRRAYSSGFTQRPDPTVMGAFSGLEIACWDILGKAHQRPAYALLGGLMNERIRSYSYLYPMAHHDLNAFWNDPQMAAESATEMIELGFTAVKFDPAGPYTLRGGHQPALRDIERSVAFCRSIREAVGDQADLLIGTHGQFTTAGAIRLARRLEPFEPLWFEEPCPPDNLLEFAAVAKSCRIPIATGERLTTKAEFSTLLRTGGAAILQPALGRSGGILETKKIAALAESFNAQVAPHLYAGPVEWAANIQLAANIPNLLLLETIQTGGKFHRQLIGDTIRWANGFIEAPTTPGLGIEFNEDLARAHPWQGTGLHLEMQEAPCDYARENVFAGGAPLAADE